MCGGGRLLRAGLERESRVLRLFCPRSNFLLHRAVSAAAGSGVGALAVWDQSRRLLCVARVLGSPHHSSPCTRALVHSQPESGVLGSLRTRGWAGAESTPPRSLLPLLTARFHPARPSHSAAEARGLWGLRAANCSACAHAFCSGCFPHQAEKPGDVLPGPWEAGSLGTAPGVRRCTFPPTGRPVTVPEALACQTRAHTDVKGKGDQTSASSGAFDVTLCVLSWGVSPASPYLQFCNYQYTVTPHRVLKSVGS